MPGDLCNTGEIREGEDGQAEARDGTRRGQ